MMARVIQVIELETIRGRGDDFTDPVRTVYQYWSTEGLLLAEKDPFEERRKKNDP